MDEYRNRLRYITDRRNALLENTWEDEAGVKYSLDRKSLVDAPKNIKPKIRNYHPIHD